MRKQIWKAMAIKNLPVLEQSGKKSARDRYVFTSKDFKADLFENLLIWLSNLVGLTNKMRIFS
jgi:hypothetical protein